MSRMIIGNKQSFAFELKSIDEMINIEVWVAGFNVSSNDTNAYGKQFVHHLKLDRENLKKTFDLKITNYLNSLTLEECVSKLLAYNLGNSNGDQQLDEINLRCRVLELGPTMDHLCCFLIPYKREFYLQCFVFDSKYEEIKNVKWLSRKVILKELICVIEKTIDQITNTA
ncbi:hypothetical protein [Kangiella sp. M94]